MLSTPVRIGAIDSYIYVPFVFIFWAADVVAFSELPLFQSYEFSIAMTHPRPRREAASRTYQGFLDSGGV